MKINFTYAVLLIWLCVTPSAFAQWGGSNVVPLTPKQQARIELNRKLDAEAAVALDAGWYAVAEADARQALSVSLDSGVGREVLAASLNAQGKDTEALQQYQAMAEQGTKFPRVLLPYALLLLKSGRYAEAATEYNDALPLLPFGDALRVRGEFPPDAPQPGALETACHLALGLTDSAQDSWASHPQYAQALDQYQKAIQLTPNSALAHLYSGYTLKKMGMKTQAQAAFAKAAALGDGDAKKQAMDALNGRRFSP